MLGSNEWKKLRTDHHHFGRRERDGQLQKNCNMYSQKCYFPQRIGESKYHVCTNKKNNNFYLKKKSLFCPSHCCVKAETAPKHSLLYLRQRFVSLEIKGAHFFFFFLLLLAPLCNESDLKLKKNKLAQQGHYKYENIDILSETIV